MVSLGRRAATWLVAGRCRGGVRLAVGRLLYRQDRGVGVFQGRAGEFFAGAGAGSASRDAGAFVDSRRRHHLLRRRCGTQRRHRPAAQPGPYSELRNEPRPGADVDSVGAGRERAAAGCHWCETELA